MELSNVQYGQLSQTYEGADPDSPISILSEELLTRLFSYLEIGHQIKAFSVCRKWRNLGLNETFLDNLWEANEKKGQLKLIEDEFFCISDGASSPVEPLPIFPEEIWQLIFSYLKIDELAIVCLVCKRAHTICTGLIQKKETEYCSNKKLFEGSLQALAHLYRARLLPDEFLMQNGKQLLDGFVFSEEKIDFESMLLKENLSQLTVESLIEILKHEKVSKIPSLGCFLRYYYLHVLEGQLKQNPVSETSRKLNPKWTTIALKILENEENANIPDNKGCLPLHYAARSSLEAVKALLCFTSNPNFQDLEGWTPLHKAAAEGQKEIFIFLLNFGCDPNIPKKNGNLALHIAVWNNQRNIVQTVIPNHINAPNNVGNTPLHLAVFRNNLNLLRLLLKNGANPNVPSKSGWLPLHAAAQCDRFDGECDHMKMVQVLLQYSDVDAKDNKGWTALHIAANKGNECMVRLLLEKGANPKLMTEDKGDSPLILALQSKHPNIAQEIGAVSNVNAANHLGWTALHYVALNGDLDNLNWLIERADVNAKTNDGRLPLNLAIQKGNRKTATRLFYKTTLNKKDEAGWLFSNMLLEVINQRK